MKVLGRLFCIEFRRAVCSKRFAITVILMVMMELLSSGLPLLDLNFCITELVDLVFNGSGSGHLLLSMFPLLPYALSYAQDMEDNALSFYLVRSNTVPFILNRFFVACLSAFLCIIVSYVVFMVILSGMGHPLARELSDRSDGYEQFLAAGNVGAYLICYIMDRGFSGVMMAACAVWVSTMFSNSFFTFTAPVCIYFLALRIIQFESELEHPYLQVSSWIEGTYNSPGGGMATFLCKLGVTMMVCMVYGGLSVFHVVRRWHYA